jgi:hypothetical protein
MSRVNDRRTSQRAPSSAQVQRDAALKRVSLTRRWVIGGAAALSAGLAALVSAIAPGHSFGAKPAFADSTSASSGGGNSAQSSARASVGSKKMPPLAKPSDLGLAGPATGPSAPGNPGPSGSSASGSSGNTGNTGASGNSGNAGVGPGGNSGNTGAASGNSGNSGQVAQAAPAPAPVTSGGS